MRQSTSQGANQLRAVKWCRKCGRCSHQQLSPWECSPLPATPALRRTRARLRLLSPWECSPLPATTIGPMTAASHADTVTMGVQSLTCNSTSLPPALRVSICQPWECSPLPATWAPLPSPTCEHDCQPWECSPLPATRQRPPWRHAGHRCQPWECSPLPATTGASVASL